MTGSDCIFFLLSKGAKTGNKYLKDSLSSVGVTTVQAKVLYYLQAEEGLTSTELGTRSRLDSATLTGVLDRLEQGGFLVRKPHPEDRRAIRIRLTEQGYVTAEKSSRIIEAANESFMSRLSTEEETIFRLLLKKVIYKKAVK